MDIEAIKPARVGLDVLGDIDRYPAIGVDSIPEDHFESRKLRAHEGAIA